MKAIPPDSATRSEFIEKIGLITQGEGLPRIAGRLFGMLIFDGNAVSFSDLANGLDVSRGSVSSGIRLLEERGLVRRVSKPGDRQDFFELAPDPYISMLEGFQKRTQTAIEEIARTIEALPPDSAATRRVQAYAAFHNTKKAAVAMSIDMLRNKHIPSAGQPPKAPKEQTNDD